MRANVLQDLSQGTVVKPLTEHCVADNAKSVAPAGECHIYPLTSLQKPCTLLEIRTSDRENGEISFAALESVNGVAFSLSMPPFMPFLFDQMFNVLRLCSVTGQDRNGDHLGEIA